VRSALYPKWYPICRTAGARLATAEQTVSGPASPSFKQAAKIFARRAPVAGCYPDTGDDRDTADVLLRRRPHCGGCIAFSARTPTPVERREGHSRRASWLASIPI